MDIALLAWMAATFCVPLVLRALGAPAILHVLAAIATLAFGALIWFYDVRVDVPEPWGSPLRLGLTLAMVVGAIITMWTSIADMRKGEGATGSTNPKRKAPDRA